jgi:hypothetical protein
MKPVLVIVDYAGFYHTFIHPQFTWSLEDLFYWVNSVIQRFEGDPKYAYFPNTFASIFNIEPAGYGATQRFVIELS